MINFIKNKLGPANCDDEKLMKRTKRAWAANNWTNMYGCCGSFSIMGSMAAGLLMLVGVPGIVPLALLGGGAVMLATGIPAIKFTDKIEHAFNTEVRKRGLWKREWDEDYYPPDPYEEAYERSQAKEIPVVLAEVFDPKAAVILGGDIRAMPSIKLKAQPRRPAA